MGIRWYYAALLVTTLFGCASDPIRLGPGECVVMTERGYYVIAGGDCKVQKLYK